MSALNTCIIVLNPVLAFWAGVYFQRWMRDRVSRRKQVWGRK